LGRDGGLDSACWKQTYGRGAGTIPNECDPGLEKAGAFCYPKCRSGYTGFVATCIKNCPSGYRDDGLFCTRDVHIYGKGCCCVRWWWFGSKDNGCCGGK
jgi:hypothetical protein